MVDDREGDGFAAISRPLGFDADVDEVRLQLPVIENSYELRARSMTSNNL